MMQEFFNTITKHLLTQNAKAKRDENDGQSMCVYHASNGRKCALGALIPDALYHPSFEGLGAQMLLQEPLPANEDEQLPIQKLRDYFNSYEYGVSIDDRIVDFLKDMQRVHDRGSIDTWRMELCFIAGKYGLEPHAAMHFKP